jgi:hypothetical protein
MNELEGVPAFLCDGTVDAMWTLLPRTTRWFLSLILVYPVAEKIAVRLIQIVSRIWRHRSDVILWTVSPILNCTCVSARLIDDNGS